MFFFFRLAITALRSLDTHFLRSLLATLGVLIGVGSVVACMSILEGMSNKILRDLSTLGSNVLYIQPAVARVEGRPVGSAQTLTLQDRQTVLRELPDEIKAISGEAIGQAVVKRFQKSDTYYVIATTNSYFDINKYAAKHGRVLSKSEVEDESKLVVCLGSKVAEYLFGGMDPVGQTVKVRNTAYRVVGVMEDRGNIGFLNADECVFIPSQVGTETFLQRRWLNWMTVQVDDTLNMEEPRRRSKPCCGGRTTFAWGRTTTSRFTRRKK